MPSPRAVLFDLDNTLVHRALSIASYASAFISDFDSDLHAPTAHGVTGIILRQDNGGYLSADSPHGSIRAAVAAALVSELRWRRPVEESQVLMHWVHNFPAHAVEMPGAGQVVESLVGQGMKVGIVSNGSQKSRAQTVDALAFGKHISLLMSSERVGIRKPDPAIFIEAARELGLPAHDCWYVGDHPVNDIAGASRAGMRAVWLEGFHEWPDEARAPDPKISAIRGVLDLLERVRP
jgi:putative hydrolase of the HAD superfamily